MLSLQLPSASKKAELLHQEAFLFWSLERHDAAGGGEILLEDLDDFFGRMTVTENSRPVRHFAVALGVHQQLVGFAEDILNIGSDEPERSGFHPLGTLGFAAQNEHGLAERGGLLLHAAGVGENEIRLLQGGKEFLVVERLTKSDPFLLRQNRLDQLAHAGIRVHRKKEVRFGMRVGEVFDRKGDGAHGEAEVFPAMAGDEDEFALAVEDAGPDFAAAKMAGHPMQRVHHRVAGDINRPAVDVLAPEQIGRIGRRREMPLGESAEEGSVQFLGKWRVAIVGTQPRLDMADGDFVVEGR